MPGLWVRASPGASIFMGLRLRFANQKLILVTIGWSADVRVHKLRVKTLQHMAKNWPIEQQILDSLVVRISACHVEGPGSIPGRGEKIFCQNFVRAICFRWTQVGQTWFVSWLVFRNWGCEWGDCLPWTIYCFLRQKFSKGVWLLGGSNPWPSRY